MVNCGVFIIPNSFKKIIALGEMEKHIYLYNLILIIRAQLILLNKAERKHIICSSLVSIAGTKYHSQK